MTPNKNATDETIFELLEYAWSRRSFAARREAHPQGMGTLKTTITPAREIVHFPGQLLRKGFHFDGNDSDAYSKESFSTAAKTALLARISHTLTVCARDMSAVGTENALGASRQGVV